MTLKKNDIVNLTITSATAEGSGVGRTDDGIAVFVQGSAIGDELNVRILKVKKTYAFGKIEENSRSVQGENYSRLRKLYEVRRLHMATYFL